MTEPIDARTLLFTSSGPLFYANKKKEKLTGIEPISPITLISSNYKHLTHIANKISKCC